MRWATPDDPGDSLVWKNHVVAEALTASLGLLADEVCRVWLMADASTPVCLVFEVAGATDRQWRWAELAAERLAGAVGLPVQWRVEQFQRRAISFPARTLFQRQGLTAGSGEELLSRAVVWAEGVVEGSGGVVGRAEYDWVDHVAVSTAEAGCGLIPAGVQAVGVHVHGWRIEVLAAGVGLDEQALEDVEEIAGELGPELAFDADIVGSVLTPRELAARADVRWVYASAEFMQLMAARG